MPGDKKTYYELLEIDENADNEAIQRARKKLAMLHHPDKVKGTEEDKRAASELMQQINHACDILSDPDKRAGYDRTLAFSKSFSNPTQSSAPPSTTRTTSDEKFARYAEKFPIHLAAKMNDAELLRKLLSNIDVSKRRSELEKIDDNGYSVIEILLINCDNRYDADIALRFALKLLGTTMYSERNFYNYFNTDDRKQYFLRQAVYVLGPNLVDDFLQYVGPEKQSGLIYKAWTVLVHACRSISDSDSMMAVLLKYSFQKDYNKLINEMEEPTNLDFYLTQSFRMSAFPDKELLDISRSLPKITLEAGPDNIYDSLNKIIYPYTSGITTKFFGTPTVVEKHASDMMQQLNKLEHKDLESVRSILLQTAQSMAKEYSKNHDKERLSDSYFIRTLAQCYEFMATAKPTPGPTPKK